MDMQRSISFWGATGIGVGAIVGGGILALAGIAFSKAGPSAIIAFALNGCIAFITARSFAEMSRSFPESGGVYTFTKKVFSVRAAFAVGWILWFASIMAGVLYALGFAFYAISALQSLSRILFGGAPNWISERSMIIILSAGATIFYTIRLGRKTGGGGQWETLGKIIIFSLLILSGLFFLSRQPKEVVQIKLSPFFGGGILGILQAMGFTFITLQGFDLIAAVAGEVKKPEQNVPRSMYLSLGIALFLYLPFLFIIAIAGVHPGQTIMSMSLMHRETVVAVAVRNYLGEPGYWLIIIAAILSMLSALYANILAASRIAFAMARDRTLPRFLVASDKESGIPVRSLYISSSILIISLVTISDLPIAGASASLVFLISFTLVNLTTIMASLRGGLQGRAVTKSRFPVMPLIGVIFCGSLAIFQGINVPDAGKIISIWLAIGFILYFAILSGRAEVVDALGEARDPRIVRLRGRSPLVLIPLANPYRAKAMVELANALSPSQVGRALLLFVIAGDIEWESGHTPPQLIATQEVLRDALTASFCSALSPEALITVARDQWSEIIRVAQIHRCESLLIGLGDLVHNKVNPYLNALVSQVGCDIVFLKSSHDWQLSKVKRILVPVGGKGNHDELRARLLGSLCRSFDCQVTFLRVVSPQTTDKDIRMIRYRLDRLAGDEVPIMPMVQVIRNYSVVEGVKEFATESDLVILGIQRIGRYKKVFGEVAVKIAQATTGATILISRHG
ncbi:amino acid permease [bacterium]|nr:amino acid permease [bacterium]